MEAEEQWGKGLGRSVMSSALSEVCCVDVHPLEGADGEGWCV